MFFKNLVIYRLGTGWDVSAAALEEALGRRRLQPCGALDMQSRGWVSADAQNRLVHTINGQHLIALGINQKILPASVIRQETRERVAELETAQGFPVGRKQMREIRERVTIELRGRALTRRHVSRAWIDTANGWLVVDAGAASRAEQIVETLRDSLGSFPATPVHVGCSPQERMAAWIRLGEAPRGFTLETDLDLQASDETKSTVRYARHALDGNDIQAHLSAGKAVVRLGLTWNDRIAFVLTKKLEVKRVTFLHIAKDAGDGSSSPSEDDQLDQDFLLMSSELAQLLANLVASLVSEPQQALAA